MVLHVLRRRFSGSPARRVVASPLTNCQPSTRYQPNCHKPTSPPTNSPPCNPAIAFIIPQYRMTETCHAFRGMCRNRPARIFCQLFHRSTVPTMPWHYHVTMLSVPTVLTCHRFDSTIIPQCHHCMMPSFHSITKLASQQSQGMPFQRTPFRQGNGSDVDSTVP